MEDTTPGVRMNTHDADSVGDVKAYNLLEAAHEIQISEKTLRRYIRTGALVARKRPNGHFVITDDNLAAFKRWYMGLA